MPATQSKRIIPIIILCLFILLIVGGVFYWNRFLKTQPIPSAASKQPLANPATVSVKLNPKPVLALEQIEKNPDLNALMEARKATYGLQKGVDMIVAPDEFIKIGGSIVSMAEVLEKIRLKGGGILEKNLVNEPNGLIDDTANLSFSAKLQKIRERHKQLNELINQPPQNWDHETLMAATKEMEGLTKLLSVYTKLEKIKDELSQQEALLQTAPPAEQPIIEDRIQFLSDRIAVLQNALHSLMSPPHYRDAYGIYVVRPEDNVWNIHFQFLREYFAHQNITLSPQADEPNKRGLSSGIGKILKFSENMIHIYNIRDRKLDTNLNIIEPLTKIIIFNMGEVLALLDQIDYSNVEQIQFDGETLWVPVVQ